VHLVGFIIKIYHDARSPNIKFRPLYVYHTKFYMQKNHYFLTWKQKSWL